MQTDFRARMAMKASGFIRLEYNGRTRMPYIAAAVPGHYFDGSNIPHQHSGTSFEKDYVVSVGPKLYHSIQMIRAFFFIFQPAAEWNAVLLVKRGLRLILGIQLLPLMLLAAFAEGAGMAGGRKWQAGIHGLKNITVGEAMVWETIQLMLMLVIIALCAYLIRLMGETFNSQYPYRQTLIVVIYTLSPLFVLRLLDAIPWISFWVPWGIDIFLSLKILYYGLPRVLQSDPSHALGLYFMSSLFVVVLTGAERFFFIRCLNGQGVAIENLVFDIAAKLPF